MATPQRTTAAAPSRPPRKGLVWVPGGTFLMGSEDFYAEERPVHAVSVDGFWMDQHPVTVTQFRRFVRDTGYVTWAEQPPDPASYPGADTANLVPGSLVFTPPPGPVPLEDVRAWWSWVPGADWRHPEGPGSSVDGRDLHPVTHVALVDVEAYAAWIGAHLPTEAEWERAARGGLEGAAYTWGDDPEPARPLANTWQGRFPWHNSGWDGFVRTSPVKTYPANGFGLYDMAGNVWEWTADRFRARHAEAASEQSVEAGASAEEDDGAAAGSCCAPSSPRTDPGDGGPATDTRVIKGGSHLCAPSYCLRYRPAARQSEDVDTSTSHLGFRCIVRVPPTSA